MSLGKHLPGEGSAEDPRLARVAHRADPDADVVSVVRDWLEKSGANAATASDHYRRESNSGSECVVG